MTLSAAQRTRRVRRPWRVALACYALLLTAGTHWPRLQLGTESLPAPDKIIHMLAFGSLLMLVWLSGWTRKLWLAGALVVAWAAIDEATQALPGLGRSSNWQDVFAGELGVIVAVAWCWALRPVGGVPNRTRLAWHAYVWEELFARPSGWLSVGLGAAEGAASAIVLGFPALFILGVRRALLEDLVLAAAAGAMIGGTIAAIAAQRRRAAELSREQPCFKCGASCRDAGFGERGGGACPSCGTPVHRGQWIEPPALDARKAFWGRALVLIVAIAVALAVAGLALGLALLVWRVSLARTVAANAGVLTSDMQLAMDLALVGVGCAAGVRVMRRCEARNHDRQAARCRRCDYDLAGTPVTASVGVCGECGAPFARFED